MNLADIVGSGGEIRVPDWTGAELINAIPRRTSLVPISHLAGGGIGRPIVAENTYLHAGAALAWTGDAVPRSPYWETTVKTDEVFTRAKLNPWGPHLDTLKAQVKQLESRTDSELRRLSGAVDALRHAFEASVAVAEPLAGGLGPASSPITAATVEEARLKGTLSDLLNGIADAEATGLTELEPAICAGLDDPEPTIRAASGRALSSVAPKTAVQILPGKIEAEVNRFTKSILKAALRAAGS